MLRNHEDYIVHDPCTVGTDNYNRKQLYVDHILFEMRNILEISK